MVIRAFLDRARTARLLEIAEGLRARYLQCDPLTGRRGFLVSPWHMATIHHPGFYEGAPDWWFGEMLDMVADRRVLDLWQAVVGLWHRDEPDPPDDETGPPGLFRGGVRRDDGYLLEIALVPSDAFEYVP